MSLDKILLGFLETPASGYDLKKAFDESVRHFWDAELSQIYPTLHRLRRDGLVVASTEPSVRGPDRKVYTRTPAGLDALRAWLSAPPVVENQRIEHLAQLFFLGQAEEVERTRGFLEEIREAFSRRLAGLRAIEAQHTTQGADVPEGLTPEVLQPYLTLRYGIRRLAATVEWCDESLELLTALEERERRGGRARR